MCQVTINFGDVLSWLTALGTLSAAVAAFVAVWAALKTHRESQAFAQASLRPILEFTTFFDAEKYAVKLHNAGQGPAIVKSMRAVIGGAPRALNRPGDVDAVLAELAKQLRFELKVITRFIAVSDTALQPNRELTIVQTGFGGPVSQSQLIKIPETLHFEVSYQSLFGVDYIAYSDR
jgi:hypothetical protein